MIFLLNSIRPWKSQSDQCLIQTLKTDNNRQKQQKTQIKKNKQIKNRIRKYALLTF